MCFLSTCFVLGPVSGSGTQGSMCCGPRPPTTAPESSPSGACIQQGARKTSWQLCREAEAGGRKSRPETRQPAPNPDLDNWEKAGSMGWSWGHGKPRCLEGGASVPRPEEKVSVPSAWGEEQVLGLSAVLEGAGS